MIPNIIAYLGGIKLIDPAEHIGLVWHVLNKYFKRVQDIEKSDLFGIGVIALVRSAQTYNASLGFTFSTYAAKAIRLRILSYLSDHTRHGKVSRIAKEYMVKIGDDFEAKTNEELAKEHDAPLYHIEWARELYDMRVVSIDRNVTMSDDDETPLSSMLGQVDDDSAINVREFLSKLPDRSRRIVELRMAGYNQEEIGKRVGVGQVQVCRILKKVGELYRRIG